MKLKQLAILSSIAFLVSACGILKKPSNSSGSENEETEGSGGNQGQGEGGEGQGGGDEGGGGQGGGGQGGGGGGSEPKKVYTAKHTLSDTNTPVNSDTPGHPVDEETWESFRNAPDSKFNNNYNYTYTSYSLGVYQREYFTKNGYFIMSSTGDLYYERKSGNTFYVYTKDSKGEYLRTEQTFDIKSKYIYRIKHEISVHMSDYNEYEYSEDGECYLYKGKDNFGSQIKFQGGILTQLMYAISGTASFSISDAFETTIEIPRSYHYE